MDMPGPATPNSTLVCHDCGMMNGLPDMPIRATAKCIRCGARLHRRLPETIDRTLALALTCCILFVVANVYPFLDIRLEGFVQESVLITGIIKLYHQGMPGLATVVLITTCIFPLFQILGLIYLYLPMKMGRMAWQAAFIFKTIRHVQPWAMMEVYMLGILISMIKLAKMATITPGIAAGAFLCLICLLTAALSGINPDDIWRRTPIQKKVSRIPDNESVHAVGCHSCGLLYRAPVDEFRSRCPRCRSRLHSRKLNSLNRTWALVIAAVILYLPANIYPVTITSALGHEQSDTLISGVIYFMFSGSWHIALVIFVASVLVPLMKLITLVYLLISVHLKSNWRPEDRTRLYRITEAVGRWSMVDVYVVTILVSLVQLGPLANITAGPGAAFFAAVVVITMFAANNFDPRLIWDTME